MAPTDRTVAFITTGGTIGAALSKDSVTLQNNVGAQNLRKFVDAFVERNLLDLRTYAPLNKFSEDLEPGDWGVIFAQIQECLDAGITQIVIGHGTDTLVYTTFATSLYFSDKNAKICFTAAFMPPSEPASDAFMNVECALQTVRSPSLPPGVYVAFRETFFEVDVFRAQDLKAIGSDETHFGSIYGRRAARFAYDSIIGVSAPGELVEITSIHSPIVQGTQRAPTEAELRTNKVGVIIVPCAPGMSLNNLQLDPDREFCIILESYHSGTIPALTLRAELSELKKKYPKAFVAALPHPYRYIKVPYETTGALEREGLLGVYKDLLPHQLYVLVTCEMSKGRSLAKTLELVDSWRFSGAGRFN